MKIANNFFKVAILNFSSNLNLNSIYASSVDHADLVNQHGIIWNAHETMCLKMYGTIFKSTQWPDLTGLTKAAARNLEAEAERMATCELVTIGFTKECKELKDSGVLEQDFPVEFKFSLRDVSSSRDYFSIQGGSENCNIGHPCSCENLNNDPDQPYYVVQFLDQEDLKEQRGKNKKNWPRLLPHDKNTKKGRDNAHHVRHWKKWPNGQFRLKEFKTHNTIDILAEYFSFHDDTGELTYGMFSPSYSSPDYHEVYWGWMLDDNYLEARPVSHLHQTRLKAHALADLNVCSCATGYVKDSNSNCVLIDECAYQNNGQCSNDATCHNILGGYACICKDGFVGDGFTCDDVRLRTPDSDFGVELREFGVGSRKRS